MTSPGVCWYHTSMWYTDISEGETSTHIKKTITKICPNHNNQEPISMIYSKQLHH